MKLKSFLLFLFIFPSITNATLFVCGHPQICNLVKFHLPNIENDKFLIISAPSGDYHDFEPRPGDLKSILKADYFFSAPLELTPWAKTLISKRKSKNLPTFISNFKAKVNNAPKEALAHFWLIPSSLQEYSKGIVQFLKKNSYSPKNKLNLKEVEKLESNLTKNLLVLNHDALAPILIKNKVNYISIGLSDHHSEISPKTIKKIYRKLSQEKEYIWLQEENHPIPSPLKHLLKGKTRYTINTTGIFPSHPLKILKEILVKIQDKK